MLADLRLVFSSKLVVGVLFISFLTRVLVYFFFLPSSPSKFGPDEGTYALLAKFVADGSPVYEFPLYGEPLFHSSKSLIWPSVILIKLGMDELSSIRTISSIYGLLSSLFLALCFVAWKQLINQKFDLKTKLFGRKFLLLISVFSFWPSNYLWSIIGLRESGSQFWIISVFYFLLSLFRRKGDIPLALAGVVVVSLTFAFAMRPETVMVFCAVAIAVIFFKLLKKRNKLNFLVLSSLLVGFISGEAFTSSGTSSGTSLASQVLIGLLKNIESARTSNRLDALSALPLSSCSEVDQDALTLLGCNLSELPYQFFSFMFRPVILSDNGSPMFNYAAIENVGWTILILMTLWASLRRCQTLQVRFIQMSLGSYIILFSLGAALYEGNLGTAFRHKSAILWVLIFILMISNETFSKEKNFRNITTFRFLSAKTKSRENP